MEAVRTFYRGCVLVILGEFKSGVLKGFDVGGVNLTAALPLADNQVSPRSTA
jgi:hypothetical protein